MELEKQKKIRRSHKRANKRITKLENDVEELKSRDKL